nr:MAG TPA: hypothetical protein [Caudoviricetes sp.]
MPLCFYVIIIMDSESKIKANGKNNRLSGRESVRFAFP